ncbi:MAG: hypothetical protein ABEK17_01000 [Candidatus Aenigmatarchaeota archaeon]
MNKAISPVLSAMLVVAITVMGTVVVLRTGGPSIETGEKSLLFSEAKSVLTSLDSAIKQVAYGGEGTAKRVNVKISGGEYYVDSEKDQVRFEMETEGELVPPGIYKKEGPLIISTGADVKAYEEDIDEDGEGDLVLENSRLLFAVEKFGNSSNHVILDTANLINEMRIKGVNVNITPTDSSVVIDSISNSSVGTGYSEIVNKGENLHDGQIKVYVESESNANYEIWYTLLAQSDFIQAEVKNVAYE